VADPLISIQPEHISAQPGDQVGLTVTVNNSGKEVEGYQIHILGPLAGYAEVSPSDVSVYPGKEETATVAFSLPSGTRPPAGLQPVGVLAQSTVHERASAVAEGDIDVAEVLDLQAKIQPGTSRGRWRGHHVIQISNAGNAPTQLQLKAYDQNAELRFYIRDPYINLPPGRTATVGLSAGTRRPYLRGPQRQLPFQVVGERLDEAAAPPPAVGMPFGDPSRPVVQAAFDQKPIISKGVVIFLALLLAGITALVVYALVSSNVKDEHLLPRGSPPKPEKFAASAVGSDSVKVTWAEVKSADSYELQHVDANTGDVGKVDHFEGSLTSFTVTGLPPAAEACFKLRAIANKLPGLFSDLACARTARLSPSSSPSTAAPSTAAPSTAAPSTAAPSTAAPSTAAPSTAVPSTAAPSTPAGNVTPGDRNTDPLMKQKWIAVAAQLPESATEAGAQKKVTEIANILGMDVKYLKTRDYPRLLLGSSTPPEPLFLIYVGGAKATQADAESECARVSKHTGPCFPAEPDP
jgi:hypothetical protein